MKNQWHILLNLTTQPKVFGATRMAQMSSITSTALPLSALRRGYRAVPLEYPDCTPVPECYIFARFQLEPL